MDSIFSFSPEETLTGDEAPLQILLHRLDQIEESFGDTLKEVLMRRIDQLEKRVQEIQAAPRAQRAPVDEMSGLHQRTRAAIDALSGTSPSDDELASSLREMNAKIEQLQASVSYLREQPGPHPLPPITINARGGRKVVNLELVKDAQGNTTGIRGASEEEGQQ